MIKCPNCGFEIPDKKFMCPRNVCRTDAETGIGPLYKKYTVGISIWPKKLLEYLKDKKEDDIFYKSDILEKYEMKGSTSGDDLYKFLSMFVCTGNIERISHKVNKKSECEYTKSHNTKCEYCEIKEDKDGNKKFKCKYPHDMFEEQYIHKEKVGGT